MKLYMASSLISSATDTAWRLGRVSFNPAKHIDPFGTVMLPGVLLLFHAPFLFGYAKPVPVNFGALRSPRRDMVLVAAAGPVGPPWIPAIHCVVLLLRPRCLRRVRHRHVGDRAF